MSTSGTPYDIFRGYRPGKTDESGWSMGPGLEYVASRGTPELGYDVGGSNGSNRVAAVPFGQSRPRRSCAYRRLEALRRR